MSLQERVFLVIIVYVTRHTPCRLASTVTGVPVPNGMKVPCNVFVSDLHVLTNEDY